MIQQGRSGIGQQPERELVFTGPTQTSGLTPAPGEAISRESGRRRIAISPRETKAKLRSPPKHPATIESPSFLESRMSSLATSTPRQIAPLPVTGRNRARVLRPDSIPWQGPPVAHRRSFFTTFSAAKAQSPEHSRVVAGGKCISWATSFHSRRYAHRGVENRRGSGDPAPAASR